MRTAKSDDTAMHTVAAELEALLPELEYSRETHAQWRDCDQIHRDRNPSIGDSAFHDACVNTYDTRIATIKRAAAAMRALAAKNKY